VTTKPQSVGIEIENVNLSFGSTQVLRDVSLSIAPGELFAFLGPSGCGKTTLLRFIAGFERAQSGTVCIAGADVTSLPPWERNVGMVFQSYALWPHMSVWRNVAFGLEERGVNKQEIENRVTAALAMVGLQDLAKRRPNQLSGGQQQRVALARTIVIEPVVLLLDEPLSNLDAKLRIEMRRELLDLQRKLSLTTIFVTHDQEEANSMADRIAVIDNGTVQQIGEPSELYDRPANRFVAGFLGSANLIDGELVKNNGEWTFRSGTLKFTLDTTIGFEKSTQENCSILIRPQDIVIHNDARPDGDLIRLSGRVQSREFLGSVIRYVVACGEFPLLVDTVHRRDGDAIQTGQQVSLSIPRTSVSVLSH